MAVINGVLGTADAPVATSSLDPSAFSSAVKPQQEKPRKRLVITQMVLENFKSYAGRQVIGPFHRSFSAIVGPNGSGKSNVIDAMLFVFGYRANKIRQGKLSELIHDSKNAGSLTHCTVEVHFEEAIDSVDGSSSEDVPNSKLVVARTATLNNQSKYLLNGKVSNYTEVTTLLREKGIDLDHKRFLILQGEVENISQMKAMGQADGEVGLLEYLEDIIGTAIYKGKIEEARKLVDDLNGVRSEKLHRAKIVEKEKNSLEDKKNEAVAFIKTENELTKQKSALYQKRLYESKSKVASTQSKFEKAQAEYAGAKSHHAEFRNETKSLEETRDLTAKECEVLERKAKEVASELAKFEREDVQLQVNRKHIKGKLKKFTDSGEKDTHAINQLKNTISTHEHDIENGKVEIADLEQRLIGERATLEEISEGLRGKTDKFTAAIEEKQQELAPWKERIDGHQSKLEIAQTELKLLDERRLASGKQLEQAKHELRRLREMRVEKAQFAESKVEELAGINEEIEASDKTTQKAEGRLQVLREALVVARSKEEEAKSALDATQSQGNVLKAILKQRDLGRIGGIYGRLGSLGTISEKYDVAISSSCGGNLDNIVVQTVKAGQQCVEFLRKSGIGRARFVILDTLRKYNMDPFETPENVPRLFDLVKPADPKFLPAFYHAISDTLVAKDMDQARRIAYGKRRYRVVTLGGNVIETFGTMTGGGNRVARGAMSSKQSFGDVTPETVAKLTASREAAELDYNDHQGTVRSIQTKHKSLQARYDELEALLPKLELELKSVDEQVQMAKKRARDLSSTQDQPGEAEVMQRKKIEERISSEQEHITSLQEQCANIEVAIKELQEKIMQAGGIRLRTQKSKVDGLSERIKTIRDEVSRWEVSHSKAIKELARVERSNSGREEQISELENQLESVTKEIETKSIISMEVKSRSDAARGHLETKREELNKIKEQLDSKMEEFNEMRTKEASLKRKLDDVERALAEGTRSVNYWNSELEHLALHTMDIDGIDMLEQPDDVVIKKNNIYNADGDAMAVDGEDEADAALNTFNSESDIKNVSSLQELSPEELESIDVSALEARIEQAEARLQRTRPNLSVLTEYVRRAREHRERMEDLAGITNQRDCAQRELDQLRTRRLEEFMTGFSIISYKLKEMYQMVTLGGNAELELVDSLDPFSEGIVFSVMPPKKSWKNISNLSGGEKTLSSLALVFALHQYKPTPLYVMDEIDAALDFRNVSIVANYIKERTRNAQFVIISLRNNMFELADRLVGIYKTDNRTKSIALDTEHTVMALHGSL
ncbi:Structural maintenance of chromosomes protein 4 [Coemansia spiralis]|uniref:Structural maintenance of chromosomes protein n=2 Tax=Coemansia TaxID=4863 RepID=A0A9W8G4Y3_9FUNG|nr:Structural maintenance of chromosomes protein 4 [Coemansia umbellata]KAJ2620271.1 Structural maintenance of chromosomes protein 4 [Coemansia sp. RSA 1358]KAJ2673223.1 Structural maintenance of chromosomes protein 4 [Coemansia spiralis]